MWHWGLVCLALAPAAVDLAAAEGTDDMNRLDGLAYGKRVTTSIGCLESAARYLRIDVSPAWLYGVTGQAFAMNLSEDLCPSGPHAWDQSALRRLARNLPIRIEGVAGPRATPELLARAREHVKQAIDAGHPCYGWHYEWVLITGYTPDGYAYSGVVQPPTSWQDFGAKAIGFLEIYSVRPQEPAPAAQAVREALAFAATWAETPPVSDRGAYQGGLAAYDTWIKGLKSGKADPLGLAYHAAVWAECRRFAWEFLKEADRRTGREHTHLFAGAIQQYKLVSDCLADVSRLWPLSEQQNAALKSRILDAPTRDRIVALLSRARDAERFGVAALRGIVAGLGTDGRL